MPQIARIGDSWAGICICHSPPIPMTGKIDSGSPDHTSGGPAVARIGDTVLGACGHTGTIVDGSTTDYTNGILKAHVGSNTTGCLIGQIITGNPTHIID